MKTPGKILTAAALAISALAIAWFVLSPRPEVPPAAPNTVDGVPEASALPSAEGAARAPGAASGTTEGAGPIAEPSTASTTLPPYDGPARDRARADRLREALTAQLAGKQAATPEAEMPAPTGSGNQAEEALGRYVDTVMQEQFVPLAGSCYEALLEASPEAKGAVQLDFSIVGDRSVGGVVLDVTVDVAPGLKGQEFETCMRESMYSVVFDAPPGEDGTVTVKQSFDLAP